MRNRYLRMYRTVTCIQIVIVRDHYEPYKQIPYTFEGEDIYDLEESM